MFAKWIVALLCALAWSVQIGASAEPMPDTSGGPPELGVAVAVDGRTLEVHSFVERMVTRTTTHNLPPGVKIVAGNIGPSTTTEVVPVVETHIYREDATKVVARRIDGRAVSHKVLMRELAEPTPVVLVRKGQRIGPLFSKLFKPDSLVLPWPPATTVVPDYLAPD